MRFRSKSVLCIKMTFNEKNLYHQIHPLKLLVDISSGFFTTYLSWQHNWFWFLMLFVMPSLTISYLLIQFSSLTHQKNSSLGKYIQKYMTTNIEAIRFCGSACYVDWCLVSPYFRSYNRISFDYWRVVQRTNLQNNPVN